MKPYLIRDRPAGEKQGRLAWLWTDRHPDLDAPLPHHQTSLIRLNYYANGGDRGHLRVD